jgi:hypothetical protein
VTYLPDELYAVIEKSVPIVCVDILPVERSDGRTTRVGLIRRHSPFGEVWCHLGGRVQYGETIGAAIERHLSDALSGVGTRLGDDPQPQHVYQWFPDGIAPAGQLEFGHDPRKHSVALSFAVELEGIPTVTVGGEALEFGYWPLEELPTDLWPGCAKLIERLAR